MRRLQTRQPIRIDLDSSDASIDGRVRFVTGPVAVIAPVEGIGVAVREELNSGSLGYLVFTHRGAAVALHGLVRVAPGMDDGLAFVVDDGVQIPQRRSAERVALVTRARVCSADSDGVPDERSATDTVTADLSLGGARLTRRPGIGDGPRLQVELFFGTDPVPLRCGALVARRTPTHLGVRFIDMQDADRERLSRILAAHSSPSERGPAGDSGEPAPS